MHTLGGLARLVGRGGDLGSDPDRRRRSATRGGARLLDVGLDDEPDGLGLGELALLDLA
ncbi:hypothetical protein [Agromyces silvae]|uniref:hypothetical protein n=1 Tax=Agromyces silvae TaxID=3388266 RepID=UPI00359F9190